MDNSYCTGGENLRTIRRSAGLRSASALARGEGSNAIREGSIGRFEKLARLPLRSHTYTVPFVFPTRSSSSSSRGQLSRGLLTLSANTSGTPSKNCFGQRRLTGSLGTLLPPSVWTVRFTPRQFDVKRSTAADKHPLG